MAHEVEIKLRVADLAALRKMLKRLQARVVAPTVKRVHEWNELFDTPANTLRKRGALLRIRTETIASPERRRRLSPPQQTILTVKRPIRGAPSSGSRSKNKSKYKVREEFEAPIADPRAFADMLKAAGMRVWFRYEKYRTTFRLPRPIRWSKGLLIELDETPMGTFLELEGRQNAIDRAAKALGYRERDYITQNYFVLYRAYCRQNGTKLADMLFPRRQTRQSR
jgi:adenylate cyclase, class 2